MKLKRVGLSIKELKCKRRLNPYGWFYNIRGQYELHPDYVMYNETQFYIAFLRYFLPLPLN